MTGVDTPERTITFGHSVAGIVLLVLGIKSAFTFTQKESELRNEKQSGASLTLVGCCYLQLEKRGKVDFGQLIAMRK